MQSLKDQALNLIADAKAYAADKPVNSLKRQQAEALKLELMMMITFIDSDRPRRAADCLDRAKRLRLPIGLHRATQALK